VSEVHVWESSQIWRREDGAIVEDRQGKHYSSDPNEAFIHVVLLADYTALRAEVERLTKARDEALDAVKKGRVVTPTQRGDRGWQANKTHCKHGHPLTPDNIRVRSDGRRQCKACQRAHVAKHDQKRRAVPTTGSR